VSTKQTLLSALLLPPLLGAREDPLLLMISSAVQSGP
jgi:hypothetical protein